MNVGKNVLMENNLALMAIVKLVLWDPTELKDCIWLVKDAPMDSQLQGLELPTKEIVVYPSANQDLT